MEEPAHPRLSYHFTADEIIEQGRTTREYVDTIKRWLAQQNDHRIPHVQDEMVVLFLLSCENDIDLTKNTIAMYFKCKKDGPEIFDDRDMSRAGLNKGMNTVHMSSIPTRTDENYVVHYFKLHDTSYSNFDLVPIMKLSYMLVDIAQEKNPPNGLVVVIDMKGFGLMHLTRLKMGAIKTYLQFLQEGFPLQLKAIHILNGVYFFDKIMAIVKVFMKSELIDMIKVHSPNIGQEELFRCIPQKCLPREYGGDLQSEKELHEKTVQQFCDKQEFWRIEELIRKS
ncbi:alpha-tocopherol transfer protein-like [Cylas formicarius]|uniref:alpha-tocopherol transfer protein-like n=1 Tax=Cylas formicarius TaxID=197179 RepID=UPI0029583BA1|nr:alpha-tocopherol transfer protein-like [Cylas formicarius]